MAVIQRISRILTADMHAVLDHLEEPEAVLKQAIRDMEDEVANVERQVKWRGREIESVDLKSSTLQQSLRDHDTKLDLCFSNDNEPLARKLVRRKLEIGKLNATLTSQRELLARDLTELESVLSKQRDDLEGMRQNAAIFLSHGASGEDDGSEIAIDETELEIALLAERQARQSS
jgi:phage shock protein A